MDIETLGSLEKADLAFFANEMVAMAGSVAVPPFSANISITHKNHQDLRCCCLACLLLKLLPTCSWRDRDEFRGQIQYSVTLYDFHNWAGREHVNVKETFQEKLKETGFGTYCVIAFCITRPQTDGPVDISRNFALSQFTNFEKVPTCLHSWWGGGGCNHLHCQSRGQKLGHCHKHSGGPLLRCTTSNSWQKDVRWTMNIFMIKNSYRA